MREEISSHATASKIFLAKSVRVIDAEKPQSPGDAAQGDLKTRITRFQLRGTTLFNISINSLRVRGQLL